MAPETWLALSVGFVAGWFIGYCLRLTRHQHHRIYGARTIDPFNYIKLARQESPKAGGEY